MFCFFKISGIMSIYLNLHILTISFSSNVILFVIPALVNNGLLVLNAKVWAPTLPVIGILIE